MEVPEHRRWMYNRTNEKRSKLNIEFFEGVEEFVAFACELEVFKKEGKFRCPCAKCKCTRFRVPDEVREHLYKKGFQPNYYHWHNHGEEIQTRSVPTQVSHDLEPDDVEFNPYEQMVMDAAGPSFTRDYMTEDPNPESARFFDMLNAVQSPLFDECEHHSTLHSTLSVAARLLSIKSDYNLPEACCDEIIALMKECFPSNNRMPTDLYQIKKLVSKIGCGYEKIDCCEDGCMLYYGEFENAIECIFCSKKRYREATTGNQSSTAIPNKQMWYLPLIPRLQRLYASNVSAKAMQWHHENHREPGVLSHPSDAEAWKHFDQMHPEFACEPRNVRLGLCADGFSPFNINSKPYSCWPVIVTPYNLPPGMCMKREYMFLTIIIPGPNNPKSKIDVYLQPLIDELKLLWFEGVQTYDISSKQNFCMKAALLWTINDFPAYGMLSGWQTSGKLGCPVCMGNSKAFTLKHGRKTSYFDCHRQFLPMDHPFRRNKNNFLKNKTVRLPPPKRYSGLELCEVVAGLPKITEQQSKLVGYGVAHNWTKRSIFWDLPYWRDLLNPHNLDVMHIEKNVFGNVFDTIMDVKGKTKDNLKARQDLELYCKRDSLHMEDRGNGKMFKPKAQYTFNMEQKKAICEWVKELKLPDGYASNLARCVDMKDCTLFGLKSHDCHVFMEKLLPIAFSGLPTPIWEPITELSQFFRDISSASLRVEDLDIMEKNIPVILCKLEKIFPLSFFDAMEHLPIHLVNEAQVGGPVHYRWMHPFER